MGENTISVDTLLLKTAGDVIYDLREGRYSILESIGCSEMREEMKMAGVACRFILEQAEKRAKKIDGDYGQNLRLSVGSILNWGAPAAITGTFPNMHGGMVFGFNHPTLGEIIRIIAICVTRYPDRRYLFPVNIVWYEEFAPIADRLEKMGLYITPIVTPTTRNRIAAQTNNDEIMSAIDRLEKILVNTYLGMCKTFVQNNDIIIVAPSATRQKTVFRSLSERFNVSGIEPKTMTLVAMCLSRLESSQYIFIPMAVVPPKKYNQRLNLFKTYRISVCNWIPAKTVESLCHERNIATNERQFEFYFLDQIANELHRMNAHHLISPR